MPQGMRKTLKFLHTLATAGIVGALAGYAIVLLTAPQETATSYASARAVISALCNYLLIPSLAIALFTGLIAIAVHRPFQDMGWVWIKALLGLAMFEATLAIVQAKANTAASIAAKIASGELGPDAMGSALAQEWTSLGGILALSVANVLLGVWRPRIATWG